MNIKIQKATQSDFEKLILFRLMLLDHESQIDSTTIYSIQKIQESVKYMKNYLNKQDNIYLIAYDKLIPVGYLHVTFDDKKNKHKSYISELYVLKLYQRQKVGTKLIQSQIQFLKEQGITDNELTTSLYKNTKTINFYNKLGYKITKKNKEENIIYLTKTIK